MNYQTFAEVRSAYPVAFLAPKLDYAGMLREYVEPANLDPAEVIAYSLHQTGKKTSATVMREYLDELIPTLADLQTRYLLVGDGEYFKVLTGVNKADAYLGYVLPNKYPADRAGDFHVLYVPNYRQVFYDPGKTRARITQATDALWNHRHGLYRDPGCSIIKFAAYPSTVSEIGIWLQKLLAKPALACDIEGFSLKHFSAGVGTISFAWSKNEGIAFAADLGTDPPAVRKLLIQFFLAYKGRLIWHNAGYDVGVLIYQLFMDHLIDTEGLLKGLEVFYDREWDDTKIIAYLATNSTAGNELGLKIQAQEFAGNYAVEEIKDITKIPLPKLLEYNLVDSLSTWFVYEKHWDTMVADQQLEIYEELFKPALVDITQMQLTGMPVDMNQVQKVKGALGGILEEILSNMRSDKIIQEFTYMLREEHVETRNQELKKKRISIDDPETQAVVFNPNSTPQKQRLLYEVVGLPVIERTKTKLPATGADVLEKLKAYTNDQAVKDMLDLFLAFAAVDKIVGTFIPAMEGAQLAQDGCHYLFGNFNLGGTVSGRLSSSDPNLQNLPVNVTMALTEALYERFKDVLWPFMFKGKLSLGKLIKSCFVAPAGWLLVGLDFASLEDRISALTTKDRNKLKVYEDGYDGHSLRAHAYFGDQMLDIETAPEGARCFKATIGGKELFFHEQEQVTYLGQDMTGLELWERLANVRTAAA